MYLPRANKNVTVVFFFTPKLTLDNKSSQLTMCVCVQVLIPTPTPPPSTAQSANAEYIFCITIFFSS